MRNEDYDMIRQEMTPKAAGRAILVLTVLDRYADADGVVQMTDAQIGGEVGMEARAAKKARQDLADAGLVKVATASRKNVAQRIRLCGGPQTVPKRSPNGPQDASAGATQATKAVPKRSPNGPQTVPKRAAIDEAFETWWKKYPGKSAKKTALEAWRRIPDKDRPTAEQVLDFIDRASATRRWRENFIPNGPTFVRQRRWEDNLRTYDSGGSSKKENTRTAARTDGLWDDYP